MIFIKTIPVCLECQYCIRNIQHGGECRANRKSPSGCLGFKADPRGCIRTADTNLKINLYEDIPLVGTWCNNKYSFCGVDTDIRINKIYGLKWDSKKGFLIVVCEIDYFINEYHEDYKVPDKKA